MPIQSGQPTARSSPYLTVTAVIAGVTVLQGANGLLLVLLPLRMTAEGFSVPTMGWVAAAHGAGFLIGCLATSRLIALIGHVRAFSALAATLSVVALAFAAFSAPMVWFLLRLVGGVAFAGLFTVAESWISERTPKLQRGRVLGFYTVCNKLALVAAPLALTLTGRDGAAPFMLVSALCSLALLPVTTTRSASPSPSALQPLSFAQLYRLAPVALVGCFAVGLVNAPLLALTPVYGEAVGLPFESLVLLFPALQLGSLVFQWPLGRWSDRGDRRLLICALNLVVAAIATAIAVLAPTSAEMLLPLLFLLGGAALSIYAICVAHAGDHASPDQMVALVSSLLLSWGVGAAIGPAVAAAVMDRAGSAGLFSYVAVVSSCFAVYVVYRTRVRPPVPDTEHVHFFDVPATSPEAARLGATAAVVGKQKAASGDGRADGR